MVFIIFERMKSLEQKILKMIVIAIAIIPISVIVFFEINDISFYSLGYEPAFKTIYKIQINNTTPIEIRKDNSALSMDAIIILSGAKLIKSYDYHLYEIEKIMIQNKKINIYIKCKNDSLLNDTISILQ